MPLIITHGWPGSVVEFHKVIEPLVDPAAHGATADVSRDLSVVAGLRILRQAQNHRLGHRSHRRRLGPADGSPGYALRRAGRRLGLAVTTSLGAQDAGTAPASITLAMSARHRWRATDP
jgi:hypothetical protein